MYWKNGSIHSLTSVRLSDKDTDDLGVFQIAPDGVDDREGELAFREILAVALAGLVLRN